MSDIIACPKCGKEWPDDPDVNLCATCGADLEKDQQNTLQKERRTLNVLFADLSGFTTFSEERDPEDVEEVIDGLFSRLGEVIHSYEGYVDKYMGDAVMAIFGAPMAHEDDPLRAVRAGLKMIDEVKTFQKSPSPDHEGEGQKEKQGELSLRVGINRGEVVWSRIGGGNYTATGDAVNVAQRLETEADPNTVLVSRSIQKHTRNRIQYRRRGAIKLEGREEAVQPYVAVEERDLSGPLKTTGGLRTRMFGRDTELHRMQERFEQKEPAYLAIKGPAGIGKSRLVHEFSEWVIDRPDVTTFWKGAASEHGSVIREPFGEMLLQKAQVGRGDPGAGQKITNALLADMDDMDYRDLQKENFAHLITLSCGIDVEEARVKDLPPERKVEETKQTWSTYLKHRASNRPMVIIIEDLHWAGGPTIELVEHLMEAFVGEELPFTIITTLRPEGEEKVPGDFEVMELTELSAEDCRGIAEEVLEGPVTDEFTGFLFEETAGNPYFLEELVRYLLEGEQLTETEDGYDLNKETIEEEAVPDTLNGLLVGRIDRLPEEPRETIKNASVAGRNFWVNLLEDIIDHEARQEVRKLSGREMVFETDESEIPGDVEYIFKHALLRDSAYNLLTQKQKQKLHNAFAEKLEEVARKNPDHKAAGINRTILARAAEHAKEAGEEEKAGTLWVEAAEAALAEEAGEEALSYVRPATETPKKTEAHLLVAKAYDKLDRYEDVLREATLVIKSNPTNEQRARARLLEADAREAQGAYEEVLKTVDTIVKETQNKHLLIRALNKKSQTLIRKGQFEKGREIAVEALEKGKEVDNLKQKATSLNALGVVHRNRGKYDKALARYREAIDIRRTIGDRRGEATCLNNIGVVHRIRGDYEKALARYRKCLDIERKIGNRRGEANLLNNIGIVHKDRGEYENALNEYQESLDIKRKIGDRRGEAACLDNIGDVHQNRGEFEKALENHRKALEISREIGDRRGESICLVKIGQVLKNLGEYERAKECFQKSESISREIGAKFYLWVALTGQVEIALDTHLIETEKPILESVEECLQIADQMGDPEKKADTHCLLARYDLMTKEEPGGAEKHLEQARNLLEEAGTEPEKNREYLRSTAERARERGNQEKARSAAKSIIEDAEEAGEKPWLARGHYLAGNYEQAKQIAEAIGLKSLLLRMEHEEVIDSFDAKEINVEEIKLDK